ncbi:MAG: hypothetical protein ACI30N_09100 [Muribaculaceae bacterium]
MRKLTAAILMSVIALAAMAQNTVITPYSRYGYGILSDNASSMQRSMGGVGYAMNSGRQINVMNPASYAAMDSLTFLFDMGVDVTSLWSKEYDKSEQQFGGGLDYITLQVPIMKRLGASVGLLPYSSVGYSFGDKIDNGSETRTGDGSLNQLYLGVGGSPFKGFGVGVNVAYLFGTTSNILYGITDGGSTTVFQRSMKVRDWRIDIGAQYSFMPTRNDRLTFGVVYSPKKDLHGDVYGVYYDSSASGAVPDTINLGDTKMNGRYSTPETWGAGISWSRRTFQLEADFTYQPWSKAKFGKIEHFETTDFADRYRAAFGGQWQPDARGGYFRRIAYRIGAYWNRDYLKVMGNNVRDLGLTVGFGLPVPGFKSQLNIGIEYRNRRATPQKLIEENYLNVTIGINFNEMWFRKAKIY